MECSQNISLIEKIYSPETSAKTLRTIFMEEKEEIIIHDSYCPAFEIVLFSIKST